MHTPQPLFLGIDETFPAKLRGGAVSIGNFDGVHRGHEALVGEVKRQARELGGPAIIVTFDPHPLRLLAPDRFMPQLTTVVDRAELLIEAGAELVVALRTSNELLMMEPQAFLQRLLVDQLGAKAIVEGFNFQFGRDRQGNTDFLKQWCGERGIHTTIMSAVHSSSGEPYSSSRVRMALDAGDLSAVRDLLGRNYRIIGVVGTGEKRGRTLGFPTANLVEVPVHIPAYGVYAAKAFFGKSEHSAAVNIGPNPTFGENQRKVEIYVIGFNGDLYGKEMQVEFVQRLRDTKRFASKDELIAQLQSDVANAQQVLRLAPKSPRPSRSNPRPSKSWTSSMVWSACDSTVLVPPAHRRS
jgi:riboflavin kinase/FMN adenylyltransferase